MHYRDVSFHHGVHEDLENNAPAYVQLAQQFFVLFMSFVVSYYSQHYGDEREWM